MLSSEKCDGVRWDALECDGVRWGAMGYDGVRRGGIPCGSSVPLPACCTPAGDVVTCKHPERVGEMLVKRVLALGGDDVCERRGLFTRCTTVRALRPCACACAGGIHACKQVLQNCSTCCESIDV